jgi:CubicO group peptidase (beta-lactamase class C family)
MTGGWEWHESGAVGYNEWIQSTDHVQYLLNHPLTDAPGAQFNYNSAAVHLLGVILEQVTGMTLPAFADQVLFGPLGISDRAWEDTGDGHVNGGAGLDLRPRDLARIGQLFFQHGVSGTRHVVSEDWVREATRAHFPWISDEGPTHVSYGYLWWTDADNDAYMAWGYRGQFIYVAPSRRLVVVATTAWWQIDGVSAPSDLSLQALDVIVNGVVPAVPVG